MCLAMMLEDVLSDAGYQVVRAARLKDAMNIARHEHIDAAILDVNLHGEAVYPLATQLHEAGVPPFMFTSAYGRPGIPEEFHCDSVMPKPYPSTS
jgi:DNA-binding response OmpR family regulator